MTTIDLWYCAEAEERDQLVRFLNTLKQTGRSQPHPVFGQLNLNREQSVTSLRQQLDQLYQQPTVMALLQLEIDKDVDPIADAETIATMEVVRKSMFLYLHYYTMQGTFTSKEAVQMYTYICKFKALFQNAQYGGQYLFRTIIRKGLELLHLHGATPLFLLLLELCPTVMNSKCYVIIKHPGEDKVGSYQHMIQSDFYLRFLCHKHALLWNKCVIEQLKT